LIGGLLLFPAAFWLKFSIWFSRRSTDRADDDFSLRSRRLCWRRLEQLGAPDCGAQAIPSAQQFANISPATRNALHFEIIVSFLLTTKFQT
jgi:hypothetical protein